LSGAKCNFNFLKFGRQADDAERAALYRLFLLSDSVLGHEAGGGGDVVFPTDERLVAPWLSWVVGKGFVDLCRKYFLVGNEQPVNWPLSLLAGWWTRLFDLPPSFLPSFFLPSDATLQILSQFYQTSA
jgi:hypothetical protein